MTAVDVVIPAWNSRRWLPDCLGSLALQSLPPASITVVDDGSTDDTEAWLAENAPHVQVLRHSHQQGFASTANRGIAVGNAPFVALLNADTRAEPEWLRHLATALEAAPENVGSAASKMLQLEDPHRVDNAGDRFSRFGSATKRGHGDAEALWSEPDMVLSASAGAALYRRTMLARIGTFDESFESYLEDVDLGLRGQLAGYGCLYVPRARVHHQGGGSELPRRRYVRLVTANRLATVVQNFPARVLLRQALRLAWGQAYFFLVSRHPWQSVLGYLDFGRRLPAILRHRRWRQQERRTTAAQFEQLLARDLGEPGLFALLRRRRGTR